MAQSYFHQGAHRLDFQVNRISTTATDGSVTWIRLDNLAVTGRVMVISRQGGLVSSYDCCPCQCPPSFVSTSVSQDPNNQPPIVPGQTCQHTATSGYRDCNFVYTYSDETDWSTWSSSATSVATVNSTGLVTGVSGGTATISAAYTDSTWKWSAVEGACVPTDRTYNGSASCPVDSASMSTAKSIADGLTASFTVTPSGPDTPTSYAWAFTVPQGSGNSPNVNFTPGNAASTTTDGHWFALPDGACTASISSIYTVFATVNFPNSVHVQVNTTLAVNLFLTAGREPIPFVSGYPATGQNAQGTWVVTGPGTLSRSVQSPLISFASSSQFYNKVVGHENRHVQQWTSGMNSDLYTVSSLMAALYPLTDTTQAGLNAKISNTWNQSWAPAQNATFQSRLPAAETDAYSVSDPIAPLYFYQSACGGTL